jgi:hypothetical protein
VLRVKGSPLPTLQFPVLASVGALSGFLVAAEFEELGWSGYASTRCKLAGRHSKPVCSWDWSGPCSTTVAFGVLITWIYNNTQKSVLQSSR